MMKKKTNGKKQVTIISGHGAKFGPKLDQAIIALMSKPSIESAAHAIGVHANTLLRWMKEAKFQESYQQARAHVFSQSLARLQNVSGMAVEALLEVMRDKKELGSTRIRAADIVLGHAAGIEEMAARTSHVRRLGSK